MAEKITIISDASSKLFSPNWHEREHTASIAADWLERDVLIAVDYTKLLKYLLDAAQREEEEAVKEAIYYSLVAASLSKHKNLINWDVIVTSLETLSPSCLVHALTILGFTGLPNYQQILREYIYDPCDEVRQTAIEALQENLHRNLSKNEDR